MVDKTYKSGDDVTLDPTTAAQYEVDREADDEPEPEIYSVLLRWGQPDEGTYSWAGQADSKDEAIQMARCEMADEYADPDFPTLDPEEVEEYEVIDFVEGANIWAAPEMLKVLETIMANDEPYEAIHDNWDAIHSAIKHGRGEG